MKKSIHIGIITLSILVVLCLCVAYSEENMASEDNANVTDNNTSAANTYALIPNCSALQNCVENCSKLENCTLYLSCLLNCTMLPEVNESLNVSNPFEKAKGVVVVKR